MEEFGDAKKKKKEGHGFFNKLWKIVIGAFMK